MHLLETVLGRISDVGSQGVVPCVAFGVDGVLCDHRPRTVRILTEFAEAIAGASPEVAAALRDLTSADVRYLLSETLRDRGITGQVAREATHFWIERFFSDHYCSYDQPMPGAVQYVRACHEAGARVAYLATRDAPGMLIGTVASLRDMGFPVALPGVELALKPDGTMSDETFHHGFVPALHRAGDVLAFFDAAPASCNLARERFPGAEVVLIEAFPVPGPPEPAEGVRLLGDLRMG